LNHLLFPTPGHVVDEGAVDVGVADADGIEKRFEVGDEILRVRQLLRHNFVTAGVAEHTEPARAPHRFSFSTSHPLC